MAISNIRWKCFLLIFIFKAAVNATDEDTKCPNDEFFCKFSERCFNSNWVCDGDVDCCDGSDEENCDNPDSIQQGLNISNSQQLDYISRESGSEFQIFEVLRNIAERLTYHQKDERSQSTKNTTTNSTTTTTTITPNPTPTPTPIPDPIYENCYLCGEANTQSTRQNEGTSTKPSKEPIRIVGGEEVKPPSKYPWHVELILETIHGKMINICGGSIINNRWILTAAYCVFDTVSTNCTPHSFSDFLQVRVGDHNLTSTDDDDVNTKTYTVKDYVKHPNIKCALNNTVIHHNNFALLELEDEIPFNSTIRPVCLPEDDSKTYDGVSATVTGWGWTDDLNPNSAADVLMEVVVPIVAQCSCVREDKKESTSLCALAKGGKGICYGDGGGPLVVKEKNKYIQVGVASHMWFDVGNGLVIGRICGHEKNPHVYARVSKVLDWIKETTSSGKC